MYPTTFIHRQKAEFEADYPSILASLSIKVLLYLILFHLRRHDFFYTFSFLLQFKKGITNCIPFFLSLLHNSSNSFYSINNTLYYISYLIISSVQKNRVLIAVESLVTDQITPKLNENERSDRNIPPSPWDRSEIYTYDTYNTRRSRISMVMHRKVLKNSDAT